MPVIDLPDDELAALTKALRRLIKGDKYPHAPRLDPLRAALARLEAAAAIKEKLVADRPQAGSQLRRPRRQRKPTSGRGGSKRAGAGALRQELNPQPLRL